METPAPAHFTHFAQPEDNDPSTVSRAIAALWKAHDEHSANEAYDRFLWAIGNNHTGTFYPVVLATLPHLEQILQSGGAWARHATLESLIDLAGSFIPEEGHATHLGASVQQALQAFIQSRRSRIALLAQGHDEASRSARELVELIDDQVDLKRLDDAAS